MLLIFEADGSAGRQTQKTWPRWLQLSWVEVWDLPAMGITGNSHFMFQEKNNVQIWELIENWLKAHKL